MMLKFYGNRELSEMFHINPAKWKRWSREFLEPDPLGGIQSGYARQYHPDQVFTVYFGGYLVSRMRFTIPEAQKILTDLQKWFQANGFCFNGSRGDSKKEANGKSVHQYRLLINRPETDGTVNGNLRYQIQAVVSCAVLTEEGRPVVQEQYAVVFSDNPKNPDLPFESAVMLNITRFIETFVKQLGQDPGNYPVLAAP